MKKHFFFVTFLLPLMLLAQGQDFEKTGFEIKAVTMKTADKSWLAINLNKELPSRFTLGPIYRERNTRYQSPMIYDERQIASRRSGHGFDKKAPTLQAKEVYAFGTDGTITGVKNIAYKPAIQGNISDAYCTAIYAARSGN